MHYIALGSMIPNATLLLYQLPEGQKTCVEAFSIFFSPLASLEIKKNGAGCPTLRTTDSTVTVEAENREPSEVGRGSGEGDRFYVGLKPIKSMGLVDLTTNLPQKPTKCK